MVLHERSLSLSSPFLPSVLLRSSLCKSEQHLYRHRLAQGLDSSSDASHLLSMQLLRQVFSVGVEHIRCALVFFVFFWLDFFWDGIDFFESDEDLSDCFDLDDEFLSSSLLLLFPPEFFDDELSLFREVLFSEDDLLVSAVLLLLDLVSPLPLPLSLLLPPLLPLFWDPFPVLLPLPEPFDPLDLLPPPPPLRAASSGI